MQANPSTDFVQRDRAASGPQAHLTTTGRGGRTTQAAVLTLCTVAIGTAIGITLGLQALVISMITIPVPLVMLWLSADVKRADEV